MSVVYIGVGNSDDKLAQREWAAFQIELRSLLLEYDIDVIGWWHSLPDSMYQNACFAIAFEHSNDLPVVKDRLAKLAQQYKQHAIAWAEAPTTEMLG